MKKQFTIAVIFILLLVVVGLGIYLIIKPPRATCFDAIQNQGEIGMDCGGPCGPCDKPKDLVILSQEFIHTIENNFDLIAKIKNPNSDWGVESLSYNFGRQGKTYVLPQETKYIIEQKVELVEPSKIEFEVQNISWRKLKDFKNLDLIIKDQKQDLIDEKYNRVSGILENKSNYALDKIEIVSVLFNAQQKIIAVNKTSLDAVKIGESRYFEISWPYQLSEPVSSFEVKAYTDVFLFF